MQNHEWNDFNRWRQRNRFNFQMKSLVLSLLFVLGIAFVSCDGRSGYLDDGQLSTVSQLTDVEWLMSYYNPGYGDEYEFNDDTRIYRFEKTGKGWVASGSFSDVSKKEEVSYFQWTFTTENFSVIYMAGHAVEGYWLIEKLTSNELWVQAAPQDPVIYPNQDKRYN